MLYISDDQVDQLASMDDALTIARDAFTAQGLGLATNIPRRRAEIDGAAINIMGGALQAPPHDVRMTHDVGWLGAKVSASAGTGKMAWVLLFDADGVLRCLLGANRLGQLRTGAGTGVSTDLLARPDSRVLACIGSGYQAWTQVEAVTLVRNLERIHVWSRTTRNAQDFAGRLQMRFGIPAEAFERVPEAVVEADVVVTITSAVLPILRGADVKNGAHVVLAGSNHPQHREADSDLFRRAHGVYVDDLAQAQEVSGDLRLAVEEGACNWEEVQPLGLLMSPPADRAGSAGPRHAEPTVFCSQGVGSWDVALASAVYTRACAQHVGVELPVDGAPEPRLGPRRRETRNPAVPETRRDS